MSDTEMRCWDAAYLEPARGRVHQFHWGVQAAIRSLDRNMIQGRIDRIRALLSNIFSILLDADMDARTNIDQVRLDTLRANFERVRNGFDGFFPRVFHDLPNEILAACP
jgi:hypothetical protein